MGPEPDPSIAKSSSQYSAAPLTSTTDKFIWRERVGFWVQYVRACARGGDSRAKGVANSLGIYLFMAVDYSFQEVVKSAMQEGRIVLVEDEEDELSTLDQKKVVEQIVNLVARDSDTDGIRRLVKMHRDVYSCMRNYNEGYEGFAERFRGHAQTYLNHCRAGENTQQSQIFAMLLFENSILPTTVYNNVITVVILDAKAKHKNHDAVIAVKESAISDLMEKLKSMRDGVQDGDTEDSVRNESMKTQLSEMLDVVRNLQTMKRQTGLFVGTVPLICLDDAVAALRDVKHENKTKFDSTNDRKREYDGTSRNVFDRFGLSKEAQHSGTLMTKGFHKPQEGLNMNQTLNGSRKNYPGFQPMRSDPNTRVNQDLYPNQRPRIPANTGLKENTACHDCGE